jgi:hypothetical protein
MGSCGRKRREAPAARLHRASSMPWQLALPAAAAAVLGCNRIQAAFMRSHGELIAMPSCLPCHDPAIAALTSCHTPHLVPQVVCADWMRGVRDGAARMAVRLAQVPPSAPYSTVGAAAARLGGCCSSIAILMVPAVFTSR